MRTFILSALVLMGTLALTLPADARVDVCYYGGANLPNFTLTGNATLDGAVLVVTEPIGTQVASIGYNTPLSTAGDIRIEMKLKISRNGVLGADGMTFVMHNDPAGIHAIGGAGDGIGYKNITKSVAVEFDTYTNSYFGDPNANHIGIQKNGDPNHNGVNALASPVSPGLDLKSGNPFWVWVDYAAATKLLTVYVSSTSTKPAMARLSATVDLPAIVGSQMYLAFTGSTGGDWSKHEIMELFASDTVAPRAACCAVDNDCAQSELGPICDPVKRSCAPCSLSDTSDCNGAQSACNLAGGVNQCTVACTGNYGSGGSAACSSASFPKCSTSGGTAGSCVACDADFAKPLASFACSAAAPTCLLDGVCGRCTSNSDCAGTNHLGSLCDTTTGVCGACLSDASCQAAFGASATCSLGVCRGAQNGTPCQGATLCASNFCSDTGFCVPETNGCFYDRDCGSAQLCDRTTFTCTAKLTDGAAIPNDGLHNGVCNTVNGAAVCASGTCNPTTNTCASASGASCTSPGGCIDNLCGSDGTCGCSADGDCAGYCNGTTRVCAAKLGLGAAIPSDALHQGICNDTTALVCSSGACNAANNTCALPSAATCSAAAECATNTCTSGHCVPSASGCWEDATCGADAYCNRSLLKCDSKLGAGAALPQDTLHDGVCSADTRVTCVSGACNTTTNTCSVADGAECAAANQCTSNTCTSGHCVPSTSACWNDTDCGLGTYCERESYTCKAMLASGAKLPIDGLHDGWCSGEAALAVCLSGHCSAAANTCASENSGACTTNDQCVSDTCISEHCVPPTNGCWVDGDCAEGKYCDRAQLVCVSKRSAGAAIPLDDLHDGTCANASNVCSSGLCNEAQRTCALGAGDTCVSASACVSNQCTSNHCVPATNGCWLDDNCAGYCDRSTLSCASKLGAGASLPSDGLHDGACTAGNAAALCTSGLCNAASLTCAQGDGAACSSGTECVTGACTSAHCVPAVNGCYMDSDCSSGSYCHRSALTCVPLLSAGAAIPADDLHTELCTAGGDVSSICASGACNVQTNSCATADRTACASNAECVSNRCTSAHCVPSVGGCFLDGDCAAGSYCEQNTLQCRTKLSAGARIPSDGLRDGACTVAQGAAVCSSGACNADTNTCAWLDGGICSTNAECVSGTCTSGRCVPNIGGCYLDSDCAGRSYCDRRSLVCKATLPPGFALASDELHEDACAAPAVTCTTGLCNEATRTCASANGEGCVDSAQCASNNCQANYCLPAVDGCKLDSQCGEGSRCDKTSFTCKAKLALGEALPEGQCTKTSGRALCASGVCNERTNTCAAPAGEVCTSNDHCQTGVCGSNGVCGLEDGASGCTADTGASICQSRYCSLGGVCLSVTACDSDAACGGSGVCSKGFCASQETTQVLRAGCGCSGTSTQEEARGTALIIMLAFAALFARRRR